VDKRSKLPKWIQQGFTEATLNLSTDQAVQLAKNFLRQMAQPFSQADQIGHSLWTLDDVLKRQAANTIPGGRPAAGSAAPGGTVDGDAMETDA